MSAKDLNQHKRDLDELHRKIEAARRQGHWFSLHELHKLAADLSKLISNEVAKL